MLTTNLKASLLLIPALVIGEIGVGASLARPATSEGAQPLQIREEEDAGADYLTASLSKAEFHVLHGEYSESTHASFIRYEPIGDGPHSLELVWEEGEESEFWTLTTESECFISLTAIVADLKGKGRIEWISNAEPGQSFCDGVYSSIRAVTTSGGCWAPGITDPNTGVTTWVCRLNNEMSCNATITSSDASVDDVTPSWECGLGGTNHLTFDPAANVARVTGATSGC